ncbi:DNA ligase (NAD(+)) [Mycoplasmopsis maculosa]|uniref:DNA ligase n=1 Tax=Mycoplasmopsis maculosa TaxID=114885 RepID=A0A449B3N2_9BACT|nr:NAD-dependent DNA ligase LigA [Mycoplasmopsis maculosa]VEU75211.1 DNA ligase (NAD(+)) [Mycoplasmopsis maculosa]
MNNKDIKNKIKELTQKINYLNDEYYNKNNSLVSDLEYDKFLLELEELEAKYPNFILPDTPTLKVGSLANSKFTKFIHEKPMLSLNKAYKYEDVQKYIDNILLSLPIEEINFSIEPKIDGLSISLHYKKGKLVKAVTRGDGIEGEDVTENIYSIKELPKLINYSEDLELRGEVFFKKEDFLNLNKELANNNSKTFANARNAASGTLRQLDSSIVEQRNLSLFLYELVNPEKHRIDSQIKALEFIKKLNIPTNPNSKLVELEDLEEEIQNFAEIKNELPYDADGLVIKLNNLNLWDKLGKTAKFPKHSIAFKYEVETAISKITSIIATVGRTGKITYVAELNPVELNQTTVSRATLHNFNFIKELNININDDVMIVKAGEIIPKVIKVINKNSNTFYNKILFCPSCKSELVEYSDIVDQFCLNNDCRDKNINIISHFVDRKCLNIVGLAISTIKDLYPTFLKNIKDIYSLKEYKDELEKINRFGKTKVNNLLKSIEESKKNKFDKVLFALGIKHLGQRAAKLIANNYSSFKDLIDDKDLIKIKNIRNIGEKIIESILEFKNDQKNLDLMLFLDQNFEYEKKAINKSNLLNELSFVITGKLKNPRDYYVELIENNGGKNLSSISSKTNYLILGEDAGSKKEKALSLNVKIITEEEFLKMINME